MPMRFFPSFLSWLCENATLLANQLVSFAVFFGMSRNGYCVITQETIAKEIAI